MSSITACIAAQRTRVGGVASPRIALAADDATVSVVQGATAEIVVTLARTNYTGAVALSVSGLPTGVSGEFSDAMLTGDETTSTLTLTAAEDAAPVSVDAFSIVASGDGVGGATVDGTVTVEAAAPPSAFTPNLPAGMTLYADSELQGLNLHGNGVDFSPDGIAVSQTFLDGRSGGYVTDSTAPWGNTNVYRSYYPGNEYLGGGSTSFYADPAHKVGGASGPWKEMYAAVSFKVDATWVTHTNGEKLFYPNLIIDGVNGAASFAMNLAVTPDNAHTGPQMRFQYYVQNVPGEVTTVQPTTNYLTKGEWVTLEYYVKMNTPGATDGIMCQWINGAVVFNKTGQRFHLSNINGQNYIQYFRINGTLGGGTSGVLSAPGGQSRYFNRIAIYYKE